MKSEGWVYVKGIVHSTFFRCFHVGVMDRFEAVTEDIKLWNNPLRENSSTPL